MTFRGLKIHAPSGIEENSLADFDFARIRRSQSRETIEQRGLPCSRRSEQNREAGLGVKFDIENEYTFFGYCVPQQLRLESHRAYFAGPIVSALRFKPYTIDSSAKQTISSTSAV